ncbi:hypothetical protein, partial [Klebsiella pneumoniae]|uniref:hypothetical protein n=1 Tax=Klebsiella pneumoniae TaxID=573 RepID=UPI0003B4E025
RRTGAIQMIWPGAMTMICQLQHLRTSQNEIKLNISVSRVWALRVWGKAGLNIECGDCELAFIEN